MNKNKIKKYILVVVLIVVVMVACIFVPQVISGQLNSGSGDEVGQYYNESNPNETLTLTSELEFTLVLDGFATQGTYKTVACCWQDYFLVLLTQESDSINATYSSTKITLFYEDRTIYFYKTSN